MFAVYIFDRNAWRYRAAFRTPRKAGDFAEFIRNCGARAKVFRLACVPNGQ
jgi:hypothetical protein